MISKTIDRTQFGLFITFSFISLLSIFLAFWEDQYVLFAIPAAALIAYVAFADFKALFFFMIAVLPFTLEINVTDSLALDVPAEPIVMGLMLITIVFIFLKKGALNGHFLLHPIILILILHWFWTGYSALFSVDYLASIKFFLAKSWYIVVFCFLASMVLNDDSSFRKFFWAFFIPLFILICVSLVRQYLHGFIFEDINDTVMPYFRNHVNYAVTLTTFFPYLFYARSWYEKGTFKRRFLSFNILLFVVAIYFSFTRAAMISLVALPAFYLAIRWNVLKWVALTGMVGAVVLLIYLSTDNRYLHYAPDYEKTIMHDDFAQHMAATFQGQDVSSMERFYRWIAALHMIRERPLVGFGPGNFYPYYMRYTVSDFETYISDNDEHSTVHNYFLLELVEQGIIGCFIFALFILNLLYFGNKIYNKVRAIKQEKIFVMAILLSICTVLVNILMSDLIEDIKIGGLFWISVAMLVVVAVRNSSKEPAA